MSHSIENSYIGELRTESTHLKSSNVIITDAPTDNNGKGNAFSPTDLVASALCSCMTTVMGICAAKNDFELPKSKAFVTKIMSSNPRRISKIIIEINFEKNYLSEQQTEKLLAIMEKYPEMIIRAESHTDSRGPAAYNKLLSERRAKATAQYVISKGISENRISGVGKGEEEPEIDCSSGCSKDKHAKNRRSEFIITTR